MISYSSPPTPIKDQESELFYHIDNASKQRWSNIEQTVSKNSGRYFKCQTFEWK